jgi:mRNA-degrading endonuclease RelE of RelBE toxin-antitoxin system
LLISLRERGNGLSLIFNRAPLGRFIILWYSDSKLLFMEAFLTNTALKQYERINEPMLGRITNAIDGLEKEPPEGNIIPLTGKPGNFRLVVGGLRILYRIENDTVLVTNIVPRGQAYTKKTMRE